MGSPYLTDHDNGVLKEAKDLNTQGWEVRVDLPHPRFTRPSPIGRFRPDITARRSNAKRIVEIKRKGRLGERRARKQIHAWKSLAGRKDQIRFYGRVVGQGGERLRSFGNPPGNILLDAHDQGVLHEALGLREEGWNVEARLERPEFSQPPLIAGHRPDVRATKPGHTRIVEIETDDRDRSRHTTFRRHAAALQNTIFYRRIVDTMGRRIRSLDNAPGDVI